ncbi:MAG: PilZ domain-containing protein [Acidobacteria bacterium]|nr:PilZ domain-containing protein [Acidobacteriota bacterium]
MVAESSTPNRRRLRRWAVSIPCTVLWEQDVITATISNISFDGALIRAESAPSEGSDVAVRFTFGDQGVHLRGSVTSEVIHAEGEGEEQTFGVKFETSMEKYWTQLTPVIQALLEETGEGEEDMTD